MKISDDGDTIQFKSLPTFFKPERDGRKPTTTREIPGEEMPADITLFDLKYIEITNTETGEKFTRSLSLILHLVEYPESSLWVFGWQHPQEVLQ